VRLDSLLAFAQCDRYKLGQQHEDASRADVASPCTDSS
jgi:hypothetical protein